MAKITIDRAIVLVEELTDSLENAYWEASTVTQKDQLHNLIRILQAEMLELNKISVQDHHYHYEPIATQTTLLHGFVKRLQDNIEEWVPRLKTREALANVLPDAIKAFK